METIIIAHIMQDPYRLGSEYFDTIPARTTRERFLLDGLLPETRLHRVHADWI